MEHEGNDSTYVWSAWNISRNPYKYWESKKKLKLFNKYWEEYLNEYF